MKKSILTIVTLLLTLGCMFMTACIPSNYASIDKKLAKNDDAVVVSYAKGDTGFALASAAITTVFKLEGDIEAEVVVTYTKDNKAYAGTFTYFEKSADAKAYYNYLKDNSKDEKIAKSGKGVYHGSKEVYKLV